VEPEALAGQSGDHRVQVRAFDTTAAAGRYSLTAGTKGSDELIRRVIDGNPDADEEGTAILDSVPSCETGGKRSLSCSSRLP
jgi:hypothetical protein